MAYTKVFTNPHPNGWDNPSERPPITADVLQAHTDAIQAIDNYLAAGGGAGGGGGGDYVLPVATKTILGGVKVDGSTITVTADGTISASAAAGGIQSTGDLINTGDGTGSRYVNESELAEIAFSGQYSDLKNRVTKTSELTNDSGFLSTVPKATTTTLGGIKLDGETLTMDINGVVSVVGGVGGSSYLADLKDTGIVTPQEGQILTYDAEIGLWTNQAIDLGAGSRELTLAEYDALTAEEKADGTDYYITDAEEMDELLVSTSNTYSLDEKIVGRWINGKPIYQKTYEILNHIGSEQWVLLDTLAYIEMIRLVDSYNEITQTEELYSASPFNTNAINWNFNYNTGEMKYFKSTSGKAYFTIQYTKTIDAVPVDYIFESEYSDSSPVVYTIDKACLISALKIAAPGTNDVPGGNYTGLWQKGTIKCEVLLAEDGEYTELFTDTSSTEGVWGTGSNGMTSYNKEYTFDKWTQIYGLQLTFTGVYRVSCDVTITEIIIVN